MNSIINAHEIYVQMYEKHVNLNDLHKAVLRNNPDIVELIISKNTVPIDSQTDNGDTSILIASSILNDTKIAKMLIKSGADINISNNKNMTPLLAACTTRNLEMVELLFKAGADLNHQDNQGYSALHHAVENRSLEIIEFLLQKGIDTNLTDYNGRSALMLSLHFDEDIILSVLSHTEDVNQTTNNGWSPLMLAASIGNKNVVEHLVKRGAEINFYSDNTMPAVLAADHEDLSIFLYLWSEETVEVLKRNDELEEFIKNLLNSDWVTRDKVKYLFQVLDTPGIELPQGGYLRSLANYITELNNNNFLEIDVISILNKLIEKGTPIIDLDVESYFAMCMFNFDYKYKLLQLLIDKGANFNAGYFWYLSVSNDPILTIPLLQYIICDGPKEILERKVNIVRWDMPTLELLRYLFKICTPHSVTKKRIRSAIPPLQEMIEKPYSYNAILSTLSFTRKRFTTRNISPEHKELLPHLYNEILELLSTDRMPSLQELSRDVIRKCLARNCDTTQSYLKSLKLLALPKIVTDIIQCKHTLYD